MKFNDWIDTLIKEKEIDLSTELYPTYGTVTVGFVVEHIKIAPENEQQLIKDMLVKIDFQNGDICHFLTYLAEPLKDVASQYIAII